MKAWFIGHSKLYSITRAFFRTEPTSTGLNYGVSLAQKVADLLQPDVDGVTGIPHVVCHIGHAFGLIWGLLR